MDRNPGSPAAPNACAKTPVAAQYALPTAEPMIAAQNGYFNFSVTPNIAGSVIPSNAETPDAEQIDFIFSFFVKNKTANTAAPCATLFILAVVKIKLPPVVALAAISCVSIAIKL